MSENVYLFDFWMVNVYFQTVVYRILFRLISDHVNTEQFTFI